VVAEVSESGSKANGGIVGPVKLNEVDPSIRTALEPLKVGEVSQPIQTARGYVVFKIESRTEAAPRPFLDVRDEVYQQIMGSRVAGETQKYLDTIRGTAIIEWKDDALRRMYEQARAAKSSLGRP
jgi:parvulin-like peptidyl-prolyl isomerase